jgi:hypothetical protein
MALFQMRKVLHDEIFPWREEARETADKCGCYYAHVMRLAIILRMSIRWVGPVAHMVTGINDCR